MLVPPVTLNVSKVVIEIVELQVWLTFSENILLYNEFGVIADVILILDLLLINVLYRAILVNKE